MVIVLLGLLLAVTPPVDPTEQKVCGSDPVSGNKCVPVKVAGDGTLQVGGTLSSAGAADTVGNNATFNGNNVCATVLLAGQLGAGFVLAAGTSAATYTPYLSEDATLSAPGCNPSTGNWLPTKFVIDVDGNTAATIATTNPNPFQQAGVKTLSGSRCAKVCTGGSGTTGSATGLLIATTVPSPPPAAGADVTDRDGRLLGHVHVDSVPTTPVTAAALPLPAGASTEATLALIKAKTDNLDVTTSTRAADATLTGGTAKAIARGAAKGTTVAADVTSTPSGANHQPLDVTLWDQAGSALDPRTRSWTLASGTDSVNVGNFPATQNVSFNSIAQPVTDSTHSNITADYDTGAGTQTATMYGLALPGSGGAVPGGTSSNPVRTDPTGTTVQPVSAASLPLPAGAATSALQTTGNTSLGNIDGHLSDDVGETTPASETITSRLSVIAGMRLLDVGLGVGAQLIGWQGTAALGARVQVMNVPHVISDSGSTTAVSSTVMPTGLTGIVTGQLAVTAVAQQLAANAAKVVCLKVLDGGTQNVKFGPTGVTTSTGQELVPGEGACRPADNTSRFFVIAAGTGSTIGFEAWQ